MEFLSAPWWSALLVIIQLGAGVLAFTAAKMIVNEPLLDGVFDPPEFVHTAARWATYAVAGVLAAGWWTARRNVQRDDNSQQNQQAA